jgi:large subunit ribosomal protein L3
MKFILGKKLGMSQVFRDSGIVVPVTRVKAGPCQIVQVKSGLSGSKGAVQLGFGEIPEFRLKKPQLGHLKELRPVRHLKDFSVESTENIERGDLVTVETFTAGDKVNVAGTSKGKGFAGVVKRHGFKGGPASHGHKDNLRAPGSIGSGGVQRVFKGTRMAGHMGATRVTVENLEIVAVDPKENELLIKGALPGARNGLLIISGIGDLQVKKSGDSSTSASEKAPALVDSSAKATQPEEVTESKEATLPSGPLRRSASEASRQVADKSADKFAATPKEVKDNKKATKGSRPATDDKAKEPISEAKTEAVPTAEEKAEKQPVENSPPAAEQAQVEPAEK